MIINLEKQQSKSEQYNRRNTIKISGISNEVSDQNLEETVICKDSGNEVNSLDIEGCHRLSLGRNATNTNKRVIVKFVNMEHSEAILQHKKGIIKKSKVFVRHSLCPYYRFLWRKCKELQRKGRVNQVFCLEVVVRISITENNPAVKVLHKKDLMICQECPPRTCVKDYFNIIVIFNFRFYSADLWLMPAPF